MEAAAKRDRDTLCTAATTAKHNHESCSSLYTRRCAREPGHYPYLSVKGHWLNHYHSRGTEDCHKHL